jgi:hypothetical protein
MSESSSLSGPTPGSESLPILNEVKYSLGAESQYFFSPGAAAPALESFPFPVVAEGIPSECNHFICTACDHLDACIDLRERVERVVLLLVYAPYRDRITKSSCANCGSKLPLFEGSVCEDAPQ